MKQAEKGRGAGYTVLEALIFLTVSAAMFISAMAFINGRQNRTEFSSAVRDFEASVNDLANDVSNGYYANATTDGRRISCQVIGTEIVVRPSLSDSQGGNQGCIFIGKAVVFRPTGYTEGQYVTTGLVGKQYKGGLMASGETENYTESGVRAMIQRTGTSPPDLTPNSIDAVRMGGGVTFGCVFYSTGAQPPAHPCSNPASGIVLIDTLAFMTTFQAAAVNTQENKAGSVSVNLVVRPQNLISKNTRTSLSDAAGLLNGIRDVDPGINVVINPAGGVYACLQSNGTKQHALVSIGGESSRFSTSTEVLEDDC